MHWAQPVLPSGTEFLQDQQLSTHISVCRMTNEEIWTTYIGLDRHSDYNGWLKVLRHRNLAAFAVCRIPGKRTGFKSEIKVWGIDKDFLDWLIRQDKLGIALQPSAFPFPKIKQII
jgi:hypothetical protein